MKTKTSLQTNMKNLFYVLIAAALYVYTCSL
jgi:hypothetical protein